MTEVIEHEVEKLLTDFESRKVAERTSREQVARAAAEFEEKFWEFVSTVVQPRMELVGNQIRQRGHNFSIKESRSDVDQVGHTSSLEFVVSVDGATKSTLKLSCKRYHAKVGFDRSTTVSTRHENEQLGEFKLEEITNEILDKHIVATLKLALG